MTTGTDERIQQQVNDVVRSALMARVLITGDDPEMIVPIPDDRLFEENETDYLPCPEAKEIGAALIAGREEFAHLQTATIRYLWKRKGTKKCGREIVGTCQRPGGLTRYFGSCDFVVCFATDFLRKRKPSLWYMECLTAHELLHASWDDETDKPATRDHDLEMFHAEVRMYGLWRDDLVVADDTFTQLRMDGVGR